ncbi:hypothetical protein VPHK348_0058 [Vibrio phage K348]
MADTWPATCAALTANLARASRRSLACLVLDG